MTDPLVDEIVEQKYGSDKLDRIFEWTNRINAFATLLADEWFQEEMENANYHSAVSFLDELRREAIEIRENLES